MTLPAWDLDAPPDTEPVAAGFRRGPVLVIAVALAGAGLGGLVGSTVSPATGPRLPTTATLTFRDFYVDTTAAPAGNSATPTNSATATNSATPTNLAAPAGGEPLATEVVVSFRLQVDNPDDGTIRLTGIVLQGVARASRVLPLDLHVAGHGSAATDFTVPADCSPERDPAEVRAWLKQTTPGDSTSTLVRVAPARALSGAGGLCSEVSSALPNGWRAPLKVDSSQLQGQDLELTIKHLASDRLAGLLVDGQLLPTVFVGDQLISTSAQPEPGEVTHLRLRGPPPCVSLTGVDPIPSTLRLLARGNEGIQQRLVIVGPALTRWLRLGC